MPSETPLELIVPTRPDALLRQREIERLQGLVDAPGMIRSSPSGPWLEWAGQGALLCAPHEVSHVRDGRPKDAEKGTGQLVRALALASGACAIAVVGEQSGDPSWDVDSPFMRRVVELAPAAVIDVHMMKPRGIELCIGLGPKPSLAEDLLHVLLDEAVAGGLRTAVNWPFGATGRTLTAQLQRIGVPAIQLELSTECFVRGSLAWERAWSSLAVATQRVQERVTAADARVDGFAVAAQREPGLARSRPV